MSFKKLECLGYSDFMRLIDKTLDERRIPLGGGIELTERCNMNCVHCFINKGAADKHAKTSEMTTEEIVRLIDDAADRECLWLQLTGGEPLLRKDFADIYLHAKKRGILIEVFTNATLITKEIAALFHEYPPYRVEISIYGATKEVHDAVTRTPGSFEMCWEGIGLLKDAGVPFKLKTMAMKLNKHEIGKMKAMAHAAGADFVFDPLIQSRYDGRNTLNGVRLSPREIVELDLADEDRKEEMIFICENFLKPVEGDFWLECDTGKYSFFVDPYGKMMPCISLRNTHYDLRKGSFDDGFFNFLGEVSKRRNTKRTICTSCDLRALCFQCPSWSQTEHKDDETPVDYLCEVTKLRKETFCKGG